MITKIKPESINQRWSKADDRMLVEMVNAGQNGSQISRALKRTRSSVYTRKHILGVSNKINKAPSGESLPLSYRRRIASQEAAKASFDTVKVSTIAVQPPKTKPSKGKSKKTTTSKIDVKKTHQEKKHGKKNNKKKRANVEMTAELSNKLVFFNRRMRRGDIATISRKSKSRVGLVSLILLGNGVSEKIINIAYKLAKDRETNELLLRKVYSIIK